MNMMALPLYVVCLVTGFPFSSIMRSALPWSAVISSTQPTSSQTAFISPMALSGVREDGEGERERVRGG